MTDEQDIIIDLHELPEWREAIARRTLAPEPIVVIDGGSGKVRITFADASMLHEVSADPAVSHGSRMANNRS